MSTPHITEDDLVLRYYGELEAAGEHEAAAHLSRCDECHRAYTRLQRVMAAVDSLPAPALPEGFERTVWARLEPALPGRPGWLSWLALSPGNLAWIGTILVLVAGAFFAGRMTQPAPAGRASQLASAEQIREGVLLVDLAEHLDRSQTMLVEVVSGEIDDGTLDVTAERAEELVAANRLYRQAAGQTGDVAVSQLLDELERLLVELAAAPELVATADANQAQQRIAAKDLLFKVRVVASAVRERQKARTQARSGSGQSS
ncbi:MAG TPA: hypothetical protein VJ813_10275 [Vicinamibacterales bacterium]|nr:hypothetical protein [Vicinamibacterales bacterium]